MTHWSMEKICWSKQPAAAGVTMHNNNMYFLWIFDQLGVSGDVALRRKNGALSVEAKSVSFNGDFLQAKAFKAGFVYMNIVFLFFFG